MSTKITALFLLAFLLFSFQRASSQSIIPSAINVGGGTYAGGYYQFDWNVGEGASIETFQGANDLIVTSGDLQPFTGKAGSIDYLTYSWSKDEVSVFPVPTHSILEVDIKIAVTGRLTMQLMDELGRVIMTKQFAFVQTNSVQQLNLSGIIAGTYFLEIILDEKPAHPVIRKGTFKIQKL